MHRGIPAALTAVAVAVALTACGSSGGSGGHSSAGSTSASSPNDIVVGGLQDGNFDGIDTGFRARITRFNDAGGLDGRKVRFLGVSTQSNSTASNLSTVQSLVLQKKVFAVAPYAAAAWSNGSTQLLNSRKIPYIGWSVSGPQQCTGEATFPVNGCVNGNSYSLTTILKGVVAATGKPASDLKFADISLDAAIGRGATGVWSQTAQSLGMKTVYAKSSVAAGTTDFSPYAQALLAAKPDVVYLLCDFQSNVGLTGALHALGFKGAIVNTTGYLPGLLQTQKQLAAALTGAYVASSFPPGEEDTAAVKQIKSDLKAIGAQPTLSIGTTVGWLSADEFVQELQATAKAGPVTPANFVKTISGGFTYHGLAGGLQDLTFPAAQTRPSTCAGVLQVQADATYKVVTPYACNPADLVKVSG